MLIHWGRETHICVGKLTIIASDNGLSPGRRQAIIWTNAGILLIGPLGTNFNDILIEIHTFSFSKMHLKMSSAKWPPFCLGLNVLSHFNLRFSLGCSYSTNASYSTAVLLHCLEIMLWINDYIPYFYETAIHAQHSAILHNLIFTTYGVSRHMQVQRQYAKPEKSSTG